MAAGRARDHRHPAALLHDYARERSCSSRRRADHGLPLGLPLSTSNKKKRVSSFEANPLILLAEWTGLEPATPGVTGEYPRIAADSRGHEAPKNQQLGAVSRSPEFVGIHG